ncbi:MAG: molybdenum cofactor biosynthesis protein MoaE [Myxococcota bacterium]|nr:molybdenum cofactor biosynthesis protein MoaE [Myxococcota bacterium]MDP6243360.1 molybdenum cofactor biosynthesis protein MoaE [Myxococcota bacterium]MDP7076343.1 molybdenum cofactor biosynthesis protein MoaE [Myxococcota bacterium]MDP7299985.1 molybdenum cofactor biosynthesis protein MoaE [Myxococcota bacterium]MDP7432730.1 molybdenum cofactor biosynthesis protein MoaE [Myxococcota bacterium]
MRVTVKLFGSIREETGLGELGMDLPDGACLRDVRDLLAREHPIFEALGERLAASVNFDVSPFETVLCDGDEVAFLPPVAGGVGPASLSELPLDPAEVVARVCGPGMGGIVCFSGAVRDHARGREIRHLEYEAYPGMAEGEMEKICDEAGRRWPGTRVAIAHRVGHLEIGELAVVIAAAAPHRAEAFEACRFAIDTLKETVPIWKKEFAAGGEYWVDDRP